MATELVRRRLTVEEYHRMAEAGILAEDDRIELIAGELIEMSPIGRRHMACVNRLTQFLVPSMAGTAIVSVQNPIHLDAYHEPQPDFVVLEYRSDYYVSEVPAASSIRFVIEVADATLAYDRGTKLPLYAGAEIPEAWLVDLEDEVVERHTHPVEGSYRMIVRAGRGESLESTTVAGLTLDVDSVLGD